MIATLIAALAWLVVAGSPSAQIAPPSKDVAAPAEEILAGHLRLPDPAEAAVSSRAAWIPVTFDGDGVFEVDVPVEGDGTLVVASLFAGESPRVLVAEPGGAPVELGQWVDDGRATRTDVPAAPGIVGPRVPRHELSTSGRGAWTLRVEGEAGARDGALIVAPGARGVPQLVTSPAHWDLTTAGRPALRATLDVDDAVLVDVVAHVEHAGGARATIRFADDGLHDDGRAADGVWGAWLPADRPGPLDVRVDARGADLDGAFVRSTLQRLPIAAADVALSGGARLRPASPGRVALAVGVDVGDLDRRLHASAEVWGTDASGALVPVAWLSKITTADDVAGRPALDLALDLRWLLRAGAGTPLELRAVRVQDPDTHVPLARADRLDVDAPVLSPPARPVPVAIDAAMLTGQPGALAAAPRPRVPQIGDPDSLPTDPVPAVPLDPDRALMLAHGYCADVPPWPPGDFSGDLIVFADLDANRSHDAFAQLIAAAGADVDSFGVVAHSQGGPAALHLLTYYSSGLDLALGGRRIQSVGSPYQGTPLAGALASIGSVFGAGCGSNTDLSTNGASLWLAGIPLWARAEVHYWTTAEDSGFCEFASSIFLSDPDDGVVEKARGQLPGGNSEGHAVGWCHTTGMSDPAQYTDAQRNAEMDAEAAR